MQPLIVQIFLLFIVNMISSVPIADVGQIYKKGESLSNAAAQQRKGDTFDITSPIRTILRSDLHRRQSEIEKMCIIDVKQLTQGHQPLIIDPFDKTKFIYPDENGKIYFEKGAPVLLSCANTGNHLETVPGYVSFKIFTCHHHTMFVAHRNLYDVRTLRCKGYPQPDTLDRRYVTRVIPINNHPHPHVFHKYEIGFYTDDEKNFLKLIEVFYNDDLAATMYVKSEVSKFIAGSQTSANLPSRSVRFDATYCSNGRFPHINNFYLVPAQQESFRVQLGDQNRYIVPGRLELNRGHLTPKSSMIYKAARAATCSYLNSAPQWDKINGGNWLHIENHVLEMAKTLRKDLTVYTGVHGTMQLKSLKNSDKGASQNVYLHAKQDGKKIIQELRIPLYFVKIVVEPQSKKGVVYVTVNNPHDEPGSNNNLCKHPFTTHSSAKMPPQWDPTNELVGYSYVCTVSDFLTTSGMIFADDSLDSIRELLYIPN